LRRDRGPFDNHSAGRSTTVRQAHGDIAHRDIGLAHRDMVIGSR